MKALQTIDPEPTDTDALEKALVGVNAKGKWGQCATA
jgi:hypothetical protein